MSFPMMNDRTSAPPRRIDQRMLLEWVGLARRLEHLHPERRHDVLCHLGGDDRQFAESYLSLNKERRPDFLSSLFDSANLAAPGGSR